MSYGTARKIFKKLCKIEIETLRNDSITVADAKKLHDDVVSLHVEFLEHHLYDYDNDDYDYRTGDYPPLFDLILRKAIYLKKTLLKIAEPEADKPTTFRDVKMANEIDQKAMNTWASYQRKQDLYATLIESFRWEDDIGAREAETLLQHLRKVHDGLLWNQKNITPHYNSEDEFEEHLRTARHIQRKVIALETKLAKIASNSSNAEIKSAEAKTPTQLSSTNGNDISNSTFTLICFIIAAIVYAFVEWSIASFS